jgi:hypothetical protein
VIVLALRWGVTRTEPNEAADRTGRSRLGPGARSRMTCGSGTGIVPGAIERIADRRPCRRERYMLSWRCAMSTDSPFTVFPQVTSPAEGP